MTTGEKIQDLRKEKGYTQEELASILGVSRQSISKWEGDIAFPETNKLIEIAKIFDVSIDYLLIDEKEKENTDIKEGNFDSNNTSHNKFNIDDYLTKDYLLSNQAKTLYYSFGVFILTLMFFLLPIITIVEEVIFDETIRINGNFYNIVFTGNYKFGNFLAILVFLITFVIVGISVGIFFKSDKRLYLTRKIISIIQAVLLILFTILFISNACGGLYILTLFEIINVVLLFVLNFNKFSK